jgi:hypothetical protein
MYAKGEDDWRIQIDEYPRSGIRRWNYVDGLYLTPPGIMMVAKITGKTRYIDTLSKYWWSTSDSLYDETEHLWYRDWKYIWPAWKSKNGKKVFWGPGVAWAVGGIVRVMTYMPPAYKDLPKFQAQFRDMMDAIRKLQCADGLWRTSLLDSADVPDPEMSSTSFFCFGMAWGVNNGLLDRNIYSPAIRMAWSAMVRNVTPAGALQWCQAPNERPLPIDINRSSREGEGAFILAGQEMVKFLSPSTALPPLTGNTFNRKREGFLLPATNVPKRIAHLPDNACGYEVYSLLGKKLLRRVFTGKDIAGNLVIPEETGRSKVVYVKLLFRN